MSRQENIELIQRWYRWSHDGKWNISDDIVKEFLDLDEDGDNT